MTRMIMFCSGDLTGFAGGEARDPCLTRHPTCPILGLGGFVCVAQGAYVQTVGSSMIAYAKYLTEAQSLLTTLKYE